MPRKPNVADNELMDLLGLGLSGHSIPDQNDLEREFMALIGEDYGSSDINIAKQLFKHNNSAPDDFSTDSVTDVNEDDPDLLLELESCLNDAKMIGLSSINDADRYKESELGESSQQVHEVAFAADRILTLQQVQERGYQYEKMAALRARETGNLARAKELLHVVKILGEVIPRIELGEEQFDPESDMPPPPDQFKSLATQDSGLDDPSLHQQPASEGRSPTSSNSATLENLKERMAFYQVTIILHITFFTL
ncbi:unnamed protein product [Protopolystoma xenopodis]|uniref:DM14 domain-containing protein n=1 Tax=Protopolystoma xenopodis TaxID=117903 RepID=A0A448WL39_9PLAT|nr:unnamed protein product [Protopolystoma xenopodis]